MSISISHPPFPFFLTCLYLWVCKFFLSTCDLLLRLCTSRVWNLNALLADFLCILRIKSCANLQIYNGNCLWAGHWTWRLWKDIRSFSAIRVMKKSSILSPAMKWTMSDWRLRRIYFRKGINVVTYHLTGCLILPMLSWKILIFPENTTRGFGSSHKWRLISAQRVRWQQQRTRPIVRESVCIAMACCSRLLGMIPTVILLHSFSVTLWHQRATPHGRWYFRHVQMSLFSKFSTEAPYWIKKILLMGRSRMSDRMPNVYLIPCMSKTHVETLRIGEECWGVIVWGCFARAKQRCCWWDMHEIWTQPASLPLQV